MDARLFWQLKLLQFFHEPLHRPRIDSPTLEDHTSAEIARRMLAIFRDKRNEDDSYALAVRSDWIAMGADRPLLDPDQLVIRGERLDWFRSPFVMHPLAGGHALMFSPSKQDVQPVIQFAESTEDVVKRLANQVSSVSGGEGGDELKSEYILIWRRLREVLCGDGKHGLERQAFWSLLPADVRAPDHSIWEHLKVTSALGFATQSQSGSDGKLPPEREPWLLRFGLGPVGTFVGQSRTGRDLWTGSFLLADLVWQAIEVFAEAYGPDCIVYPDLHANPRADCWLKKSHERALREGYEPHTYAAVVPNAFVAIVPRGGDGHLEKIESIAKRAHQAVLDHWDSLQRIVRQWLSGEVLNALKPENVRVWQGIWDEQFRRERFPLRVNWAAIPWTLPERIGDAKSLDGQALPAIPKEKITPLAPEPDRQAIQQRRMRLKPWVSDQDWVRYGGVRRVFANLNLERLQGERGFDYALLHHKLGARHELGKQVLGQLDPQKEAGEKCTLCGERQALHAGGAYGGTLENLRQQARDFWSNPKLDPDEAGSERLCAPCTIRRFLVEAGFDANKEVLTGINPLWAGDSFAQNLTERWGKGERVRMVRLAFPSTSMIATQVYLENLASYSEELQPEMAAVIEACKIAACQRTAFPKTLPRLQSAIRQTGVNRAFFEFDPQDTLFETTQEGKIQRLREGGDIKALKDLQKAVRQLRIKATRLDIADPDTRIAVIKMDGDNMGKLLLGASDKIGAAWREILHPEMLDRIVSRDPDNPFVAAGWPALLEGKRLMGPSLHAFISRALAEFAHCIVPWVVEREFGARLIYSGGDDVLCIAPAADALDLVARLQQLWSAAWVLDLGENDGQASSDWHWRSPDWSGSFDTKRSAQRFQVIDEPSAPIPGLGVYATAFKSGSHHEIPLAPNVSGIEKDENFVNARLDNAGNVRLVPMLGKVQSLSAGIVFAHYKSHMGHRIREAEALLTDVAKEKLGRGSLAMRLHARNGLKSEFGLRWGDTQGAIVANRRMNTVIGGFRSGAIAGRLPYKLREDLLALRGLDLWDDRPADHCVASVEAADAGEKHSQSRERLLRGLLKCAWEGDSGGQVLELVLLIWKQGFELIGWNREQLARSVDGLLLCRALARPESEAEEE